MQVYLVLHHEIMGATDDLRNDGMLFYTCSSMEKAIELIKKSSVVKWSWWEIQVQDMDSFEWPTHVAFYGRLGDKLDEAPYLKCLDIFKKENSD